MQVNVSVIISLVALVVSLVTLYLQWFRVRGAVVSLLNDEKQVQRTILLPSYDRLPDITRQQFPEYKEKNPGCTQIRLNFPRGGAKDFNFRST